MKIQTLLELIEPTISKQRYNGNFRPSEDIEGDASGAYATVSQDKTDPHMVRKHHHTPTANKPDRDVDSYVYFALWLAKTKTYNICFPKIYDIKKIEDRDGEFIYKYKIEKLLSYRDLDRDAIISTFSRYFNLKKVTQRENEEKGIPSDNRSLVRMFGRYCEEYMNGDIGQEYFISQELVDALNSINDFQKWMENTVKRELVLDIANSGNIMFRRTGVGLQLVITDPVA